MNAIPIKHFKNNFMVLCEKTNNVNSEIVFSLQRFLQIYNSMLIDIPKIHVICSYNMLQIKKINIPSNLLFHKAGHWQEKKGSIRLMYHLLYFLSLIKTSSGLLKNEKNISVIMNLMNHQTIGVIAVLLSKITGRKSVVRITNENIFDFYKYKKKNKFTKLIYKIVMLKIEQFVLDEADVLISVSPIILEKYPQYEYKLCIIPVTTPALEWYCHKKIVRKVIGKSFHVLFVGRLEPIKGVNILLEALVGLKDIMCSIVGTGSMEYRLKERVIELQLQDRVSFYSVLPQEKVFWFMENSDVLVLPSHSDYAPNVLIEAAAIGTPIIASNVGGIKYLVKHKETGLLFMRGDVSDLRGKISFMRENPDTREIMRKAAKDEICTIHSPTIKSERIEKLFELLYNE